MTTPAWANDHCTSPEQSKADGPFAPQMYGMPTRLSAARSMARSTAAETRPPVTGATEPVGALRATLVPLTWTTSCWTLAECGMSFLTWRGNLVGWGAGGAVGADHECVAHREPQ